MVVKADDMPKDGVLTDYEIRQIYPVSIDSLRRDLAVCFMRANDLRERDKALREIALEHIYDDETAPEDLSYEAFMAKLSEFDDESFEAAVALAELNGYSGDILDPAVLKAVLHASTVAHFVAHYVSESTYDAMFNVVRRVNELYDEDFVVGRLVDGRFVEETPASIDAACEASAGNDSDGSDA